MKKTGKLILIALLVLILVGTLFACNVKYNPPDYIDGGVDDRRYPGIVKYLIFTYKDAGLPFGTASYYLDEFGLDKISFQVIYVSVTDNKTDEHVGEAQPLVADMISENDLTLLQTAGQHEITATYETGNRAVSGKFKVVLEERYVGETINLTFDLGEGVNTVFGSADNGKIVKKIYKNKTYGYLDFVSGFKVFKPEKSLAGWRVDGNFVFDASSGPYKFSSDVTLTPIWMDDTVNITFELNIPDGAKFAGIEAGGEGYSEVISGATPKPQIQARRIGVIQRPDFADFDMVDGWNFAGWKVKGSDELWNFHKQVGSSDMILQSVWRLKPLR